MANLTDHFIIPGYTISLLIWVVPVFLFGIYFKKNKLLRDPQKHAIFFNILILSLVGISLDFLFADKFFTFPDKNQILRIYVDSIPIEEFVFYIGGFWFILFFYVFCDEVLLVRYNLSDSYYLRYAKRLKRKVYLKAEKTSVLLLLTLTILFIEIKNQINPAGSSVPGYMLFLLVFAFIPYYFFWRVAIRFVNFPALILTMVSVFLISFIWEVTFALPFGYWNYQHGAMLGIFFPFWNNLPVEQIFLYLLCSLIVLTYEYSKIFFFAKGNKRI